MTPDHTDWSGNLASVAAAPLVFCPGFPDIARRHEAWWNQAIIDRPLFIGTADRDPARPVTRRIELLSDPDAWMAAKLDDLKQTCFLGDALPHVRVDFGPVLLGAMLGGRTESGADTTWTHAFISDDWSNAPGWELRDNSPCWPQLCALTDRVAAEAAGRFLVCTPDLGGSADVLLNLRGATGLCMDAMTRPETLIQAIDAIYPAWERAFTMLYDTATAHGAGLIHWLLLWSSVPHFIPACDFNFMIAPEQFNRICLPDIARQTAAVGRGVFHLDGAGATNHIDALLEIPEMRAIQYVPGAGTPSALAWVDMFRKVQDSGRSVIVDCPMEEVLPLCEALKPEGLALSVRAPSAEGLDGCYAAFCRRFGA